MTLAALRERIDLAAAKLGYDAKVELIIGGKLSGDPLDLETVRLDLASPLIDKFYLGSSLLTPPPTPNDVKDPS